MEAKELRMYNYIHKNGEIYEVWEETFSDIAYDRNIKWEPIVLTEDWLIRFGFKKDILPYFGSLIFEKDGITLDHDFVLMDIDKRVEIKYVHQLQNLYFALTGEELQLK